MSAQGPARRASTTRTDWETPQDLFAEMDREFRFTLDAAASERNRKCERYLTEEEDALGADIFDQVVWCNPPYGDLLPWVKAFWFWSISGCTVVALLPANTDTEWFRWVWLGAHEIIFLTGRVNFIGSKNGNTGGSMIAIYRPQPPAVWGEIPRRANVTFSIDPGSVVPPRVRVWSWRPQPEKPAETRRLL